MLKKYKISNIIYKKNIKRKITSKQNILEISKTLIQALK